MKASVTLEPNIGKLGFSSLIDDASHECLALVQGKGSDVDLVALKTRLLEKLVPVRRNESECVMTAVPRSCFALAFLFQKSDPAKSEIRKKRNLFFFFRFSLFFPSFAPFLSKRQNDIFDQKRSLLIKKRVPKNDMFFVIFGPFCDLKAPFFDQKAPFSIKIFPFFIKNVSLFQRPTSFKVAQRLHRTHLDDDLHDASYSTNGESAKAHAL